MKKAILLISVVLLLIAPVKGYSKTMAYMFAAEQVLKLDTDLDSIVSSTKAPFPFEGYIGEYSRQGCIVDLNNKLIMAGYSDGPYGFYVYDLQTLNLVRFVTLPDMLKRPTNLRILYPELGAKFYVEVRDRKLNNGQGGIVTLAYDKKTQSYLGSVDNILNDIDEKFWLSEDQSTIYVTGREPSLRNFGKNLRHYDSQTLKLTDTMDFSNIYAQSLWSKAVGDVKSGIILLKEYTNLQDISNLSFFTYNIATATTSTRVNTGIDDKASLLTPDAKKLIINETKRASSSGTKAPTKGNTVTGRIHVYDVATGRKLGLVTLPTDFGEKILGVRPQSDKLYYLKYSKDESNIRLYVVDLTGLKVIKEITVPNLFFMVFFEE